MSDVGFIDNVSCKQSLGRLSSKANVSVVSSHKMESTVSTEGPQELKKLAFEMEEAEHAFALMMDIRQQIEKAFHELIPPE